MSERDGFAPELQYDQLTQRVSAHRTYSIAESDYGDDAVLREYRDLILSLLQNPRYQPPTLPDRALELARLSGDNEAGVKRLGEIIRSDPNLAANVLRVGNSAQVRGVGSPIDSIERAVVLIGLDGVRNIALAWAMRAVFLTDSGFREKMQACFSHSVAVANGMAYLADRIGLPKGLAYVSGLLHDIGEIVILHALDALMRKKKNSKIPSVQRLLDELHAEAGSYAIKHWGLPDSIAQVCARHHDDMHTRGTMITAVRAVDLLAQEIDLSPTPVPEKMLAGELLCLEGLSLDDVEAVAETMRESVANFS